MKTTFAPPHFCYRTLTYLSLGVAAGWLEMLLLRQFCVTITYNILPNMVCVVYVTAS